MRKTVLCTMLFSLTIFAISCSGIKNLPINVDPTTVSFSPKITLRATDNTPPTLQISEPAQLASSTVMVVEGGTTVLQLSGAVLDDVEVKQVTINGQPVAVTPLLSVTGGTGVQFRTSLPLVAGENVLHIAAVDASDNQMSQSFTVTVSSEVASTTAPSQQPTVYQTTAPKKDVLPPTIKITAPYELASGKAFTVEAAQETITLAGTVSDNTRVEQVTVNGQVANLNPAQPQSGADGHAVAFSTVISLVAGENAIRITASDVDGNTTDQTFTITAPSTPQPPVATIAPIEEEDTTVGGRWALLVGVDRYDKNQQGDYYLPNLTACVKDVKAIDAVLRDAERGGFEHVTTLVSNDTADPNDDPTDRNVLNALREIVDQVEKDDLVVLYFSGHGWQHEGEAYLLTQNFEMEFPSRTAIRSADLNDMIHRMKAEKVVTILDACHSGGIEVRPRGGKAGGTQVKLNEQYQQAFKTSAGKVVLHSCDANEKSWELEDSSQGVFSKYLVEGLQGAADARGDQNGVITIQEAYQYAHQQVVAHMKRDRRGKQTPVLSGMLVGEIPLTIEPQQKAKHLMDTQVSKVYELIEDAVVAERAITLLKKRTEGSSLSPDEERLLNYLDNLLAGKISAETYLGAHERFNH